MSEMGEVHVGVWLTAHKHPTGMQYAIFYDPIPKFLVGASSKIRLDTHPRWEEFKKVSLMTLVEVFFENK